MHTQYGSSHAGPDVALLKGRASGEGEANDESHREAEDCLAESQRISGSRDRLGS
jgi:hypothetical protein